MTKPNYTNRELKLQLVKPRWKKEKKTHLKERVLTAGNNKTKLEDPDIFEEASREKNRAQKGNQNGKSDSQHIF